jgi:uncharacterized membrane protein (DUF106 family)
VDDEAAPVVDEVAVDETGEEFIRVSAPLTTVGYLVWFILCQVAVLRVVQAPPPQTMQDSNRLG